MATKKNDPKPKKHKYIEQDVKKVMNKYQEMYGTNEVAEPARVCSHCLKSKALRNYYMARNPMMHNKRIGVCKYCLKKNVQFHELGEAQYFLTLLNWPFIDDLWTAALDHEDPIGFYLRAMNFEQYQDIESATLDSIKAYTADAAANPYWTSVEELSEYQQGVLFAKWGEHYSMLDCVKLEEYYNDMMQDYEIKTRAHQDYLKNIAKTSLVMDQMLANGDYDGYKKLAATYDALMKSANFAEAKSKDDKKDAGYNAFGLLFQTAEKEGFIPQYHNNENPDIVDKTIKNLKSWTDKLVKGETDLNELMENAAKRVLEQEKQDERKNDDYYGVAGLEDAVE